MAMTAVLFHSVGLHRLPWAYQHIAQPPDRFEAKLRALERARYRSRFFVEVDGARNHDAKEVALTFDDGYLDNWVHVFPILEQLRLKATMFVTPEFIDPRPIIRPRVEPGSYIEDRHEPLSCCAGFLSWSELREMQGSGLVDVQSHGLSHTRHFAGPRIVDFWRPGSSIEPDGPVWMLWNQFPQTKPYYLSPGRAEETRIPYGTPIYENGHALEVRRYFPDTVLDRAATEFVAQNGGEAFFADPHWRNRMVALLEPIRSDTSTAEEGRFENVAESKQRVQAELAKSKALIGEHLNKSVEAFCWPGGGASEATLDLARMLGYRRFTLPPQWQAMGARARDPELVPRVGGCSQLSWRGRELGACTPRELLWRIEAARGSRRHRVLIRASLAGRLGWSISREYLHVFR